MITTFGRDKFISKQKKLSLTEFIEEVFLKTFHTILKISTFITKKRKRDANLTTINILTIFLKPNAKLTNLLISIQQNIDFNFSLK